MKRKLYPDPELSRFEEKARKALGNSKKAKPRRSRYWYGQYARNYCKSLRYLVAMLRKGGAQ